MWFQSLSAAILAAIGYDVPPEKGGLVPIAQTKNGTYSGVHNPAFFQDFFLGVPYAQPPVDNLRFTVPQPLDASWDGRRNATQYSSECIGLGVSANLIYWKSTVLIES
jgi:carboxylesterase type B